MMTQRAGTVNLAGTLLDELGQAAPQLPRSATNGQLPALKGHNLVESCPTAVVAPTLAPDLAWISTGLRR